MQSKFLKPARGLLVRLEDATRHLLAEGETVRMSSYWRRRIRDGDVAEAKPPKPAEGDLIWSIWSISRLTPANCLRANRLPVESKQSTGVW